MTSERLSSHAGCIERHVCDVLVIGSGAGGMSAAATARLGGLDVLLVEKTDRIGGTTAFSGGGLWVPANPLAKAAGVEDDVGAARRYVESLAGNHIDPPVLEAFLATGPDMVSFFHANTDVRFVSATTFPDYHPNAPGAGVGRTLLTEPFDSRRLGEARAMLREPLRQMTLGGMTLASGDELWHFLRASRSTRSALYVARVMARHQLDRIRYGHGTRLTNGNALAGRLLKSLLGLGVQIWRRAAVIELAIGGTSKEALIERDGVPVRIEARRGIVLACGGFPHDAALQQCLFPHVRAGNEHVSPAPAGNNGDGLRLGVSVGGLVRSDLAHAAAWVPVSLISDQDKAVFPHLVDRQKPGFIAIDGRGRRFVNEAESYHDFVPAMLAMTPPGEAVVAYLVCDHEAIRRYGLGYAKPWPIPLGPHLRSGYLKRGRTPEELAAQLGLDTHAFRATLERFNKHAEAGHDPDFGRGSTSYNRFMGDPTHTPNPCLAPLRKPPYYSVRLEIGDLGTFAGLKVDAHARVLDKRGRSIDGLYAVGNDMASVLGGSYPGAGSTLGPAMVFGFIAGRHLAT